MVQNPGAAQDLAGGAASRSQGYSGWRGTGTTARSPAPRP
jgi:hypothetical protein